MLYLCPAMATILGFRLTFLEGGGGKEHYSKVSFQIISVVSEMIFFPYGSMSKGYGQTNEQIIIWLFIIIINITK